MPADTLPAPRPQVQSFFDPVTCTVSHVVFDRPGGSAAVIDPVLDYDAHSGRTRTSLAERIVDFVRSEGLSVPWILETHAHADHLSAASWLKRRLDSLIAIGAGITSVQAAFKSLFHLGSEMRTDGSPFDLLLHDGHTLTVGSLSVQALAVPGHTPACTAYRCGQGDEAVVFVGDTLFMPDVGSARCDFPGGDAHALYRSARRLLQLPAATRLFMCHDYPPLIDGHPRPVAWETTVAAQRARNIHLHDGVGEQDFVAMRQARDLTLDLPALMLPAVQVKIRAGQLPQPEANGVSYLKIPINTM